MHRDHRVVVGLVHLQQRLVPDDAGVVDEDVDRAEGVDRSLDDPPGGVEVAHGVVARDRAAAGLLDVAHRHRRRVLVGAAAVEADADVVDHDRGAFGGEAQGEFAPDAPT